MDNLIQEDQEHSSDEYDDNEHEDEAIICRIENPKHVSLLENAELDKIKEFDPQKNRVDRMILERVINELNKTGGRHSSVSLSNRLIDGNSYDFPPVNI